MHYENFKEVIHGRRSVRKFTEQEVATSDIKEIIDCARYAPSDTNSQTWEFLVIMNREKIKEIEQVYEADECFFTATPLEIFPVVQIGDEQFGNGERGPITKRLQVAYEESIRLFKVTN